MIELEYAQITNIGNRHRNQDYQLAHVDDDWAVFVVADGLGAYEGSELAAQYFCQALVDRCKVKANAIMHNPSKGLKTAILNSAEIMGKRLIKEHYLTAQTTCAVAWLDQNQICVAHVGDSRVYRINKKGLQWRTKDDSLAQQLVDEGAITEAEMARHPSQTQLLHSINADNLPSPHIRVYKPLGAKEVLLLCTDGFWEEINLTAMTQLIDAAKLEKSLQTLVKQAVKSASPNSDNVTAQVIRKISA